MKKGLLLTVIIFVILITVMMLSSCTHLENENYIFSMYFTGCLSISKETITLSDGLNEDQMTIQHDITLTSTGEEDVFLYLVNNIGTVTVTVNGDEVNGELFATEISDNNIDAEEIDNAVQYAENAATLGEEGTLYTFTQSGLQDLLRQGIRSIYVCGNPDREIKVIYSGFEYRGDSLIIPSNGAYNTEDAWFYVMGGEHIVTPNRYYYYILFDDTYGFKYYKDPMYFYEMELPPYTLIDYNFELASLFDLYHETMKENESYIALINYLAEYEGVTGSAAFYEYIAAFESSSDYDDSIYEFYNGLKELYDPGDNPDAIKKFTLLSDNIVLSSSFTKQESVSFNTLAEEHFSWELKDKHLASYRYLLGKPKEYYSLSPDYILCRPYLLNSSLYRYAVPFDSKGRAEVSVTEYRPIKVANGEMDIYFRDMMFDKRSGENRININLQSQRYPFVKSNDITLSETDKEFITDKSDIVFSMNERSASAIERGKRTSIGLFFASMGIGIYVLLVIGFFGFCVITAVIFFIITIVQSFKRKPSDQNKKLR